MFQNMTPCSITSSEPWALSIFGNLETGLIQQHSLPASEQSCYTAGGDILQGDSKQ